MNEAVFSRRDDNRRGGFTLIEVVIALAIFLFGAVAIIRIFPPALGVIQNSGDRLTAVNFNRTTLARYAKDSSALPYAIYDQSPVAFAGSTTGSAIRNNAIPRSNVQNIAGSSLDHFKVISGEKQKVHSFGGIFYVLTSFPVASLTPQFDPAAKVYKEVAISGVTTQTKTLGANKSGFLDFSNASSAPPAAPINPDELTYYVSYKYFENNVLNSTNDEPVRSRSGTYIISGTAPNLNATNTTDVQVLQGRRPTGVNVADGPVQVRYRQLYGAIAVDYADAKKQKARNNLGIIVLTGPTLTDGEEVSVDYQVNSWSQLVSNSSPSVQPESDPAVGPNPTPPGKRTARDVVLPLRFLDDGSTDPNASTYSLLSYFDTTGAASMEANEMKPNDVLEKQTQFTLWSVNRKAGRVTFDISNHLTPNSTDFTVLQSRVVYQTLDKWTHQVSVAPTNYTPYYDANTNNVSGNVAGNSTSPQPWRYYHWDGSTSTPGNNRGRIYFPPSEAGKTISLSYSYGAIASPTKVEGGVVTISDRWILDTDAPLAARDLAVADQNDPAPIKPKWLAFAEPKLANTAAVPLLSIQSIKGVSVQARTAWLDGDKFNQVSTVGFRGDSN